ncbi:MAG: hypothetical protein LKE86_00190 [Eubacterium sp.]|jgi:hypothetical protein|nr:hypothetical protein [Eubacterium sp.]MCH4045869.1 hypothetical protein [Eubacterium sp.]MCH4078962.1 hypothetical protein [Eubacterium sp.]
MSDRKLSAFDRNFDFNDDGHLSSVENGVRTAAIMQTIEHRTNCEEEYDFEDNATDSLGEAADDLDSLDEAADDPDLDRTVHHLTSLIRLGYDDTGYDGHSEYDEWAKNIVGPEDIDMNDLIKP